MNASVVKAGCARAWAGKGEESPVAGCKGYPLGKRKVVSMSVRLLASFLNFPHRVVLDV